MKTLINQGKEYSGFFSGVQFATFLQVLVQDAVSNASSGQKLQSETENLLFQIEVC